MGELTIFDTKWLLDVRGLSSGVAISNILLWDIVEFDSSLVVGDVSPNVNMSLLSKPNAVMGTAIHLREPHVLHGLDWFETNHGSFQAIGDGMTGLTRGIETPAVEFPIGIDCKAVIVATADLDDLRLARTYSKEHVRNERMRSSAINDATAKLRLLASAPGPCLTLLGESHNVVCATLDINDVLQRWEGPTFAPVLGRHLNEYWSQLLYLGSGWVVWVAGVNNMLEAQKTLVILQMFSFSLHGIR